MEQGLIKEGLKLLPKIKDGSQKFNEQELSIIKAIYENLAKTKVYTMMSCGGKLCEEYRRTVTNYLNTIVDLPEIKQPVNEVKKLPVNTPKVDDRDSLMLEAISIASKKGIKKPNPNLGVAKLKKFINENK